jgi:hypothetical protein
LLPGVTGTRQRLGSARARAREAAEFLAGIMLEIKGLRALRGSTATVAPERKGMSQVASDMASDLALDNVRMASFSRSSNRRRRDRG